MSSRLTTEEDYIEFLAKLTSREWTKITTHISWAWRNGKLEHDQLPQKVRAFILDKIEDPDEWKRIRQVVSKRRRALYRQRVKEERAVKIERRRDYMRAYMAKYRSKL